MSQDLTQRLLVNGISTILIAVLIFFAEYSPMKWIYTAAIAAVASVAIWEYCQLLRKKELSPAIFITVLFGVIYIFSVFLKTQRPLPFLDTLFRDLPSISLGLALFCLFVLYAVRFEKPILNISTSFLGLIYVAIPMALFIKIMYFFTKERMHDPHFQGSWWIVYLIAVTKSADMGGYFIGKKFGRHKLALKLSPNKTIEGFVAGLAASLFASLFLCYLGKEFGSVFKGFTYLQAALLGLVVAIMGGLGDLAESLLKRDADVKDSNTLPGVGGILDMIDSLLFTAPIVYIFLRMFYT